MHVTEMLRIGAHTLEPEAPTDSPPRDQYISRAIDIFGQERSLRMRPRQQKQQSILDRVKCKETENRINPSETARGPKESGLFLPLQPSFSTTQESSSVIVA